MKSVLSIFHNIYSYPAPARTVNGLHHKNMIEFLKAKPWKPCPPILPTKDRTSPFSFQDFLTLKLVST